jgi:hypothetical protein
MQHRPSRLVLATVVGCLALIGCADQPDPAPTSTSPLPAWKTNTAAEAERILREYLELSAAHMEQGGTSPLPAEFKKYLSGDALEQEAKDQAQMQEFGLTFDYFDPSLDAVSSFEDGNRPIDSVYSIEACITFSQRRIMEDGSLGNPGTGHTYSIYDFAQTTDGSSIVINHMLETSKESCELIEQ